MISKINIVSAPTYVIFIFLSALCIFTESHAGKVQVAVATNFIMPLTQITSEFEKQGHTVKLSSASSGKIFAQILHGAPYDVFLSADAQKPERLVKENLALENTRFTYAYGTLVLWSPVTYQDGLNSHALKSKAIRKVALANPKLAPYGAAAIQTLNTLNKHDFLKEKLVYGENIAQAYQFVKTANADLGFIAASQVFYEGEIKHGSAWIIPKNMYKPIRQDAVLLKKSSHNIAAKEFLGFMKSPIALEIIQRFGYSVELPSKK